MSSYKKLFSVHYLQEIIYRIRLSTIGPGGHRQLGTNSTQYTWYHHKVTIGKVIYISLLQLSVKFQTLHQSPGQERSVSQQYNTYYSIQVNNANNRYPSPSSLVSIIHRSQCIRKREVRTLYR